MKQVVAFCLGLLMCAVSNAQDVADWSEEVKYNKPASTSNDTLGKEVFAEPLDGSIDVTMAPGVKRSFKNVTIGDFHAESYYFEEIQEKPDFMTFKTDAVKKVILPSPSKTVVDFTLTAAQDAPEGKFTIKVRYNFHFGGPVVTGREVLTVSLTIANIPAPVADFTSLPTSGPTPLRVQFTDRSSGIIEGRAWDFGDGFTSTETNPLHFYSTVGTYTVSLTVDGPGGSIKKTRENYITVTEPPPVANFTATPRSGAKPLAVQFTDASTGQITSRLWNFGDGQTSTETNPSHTYNNDGTYTVALTVTGPGGSDTETKTNYITVAEPAPVADFEGTPTSGVRPLTVQFTDKSTGVITEWGWAFGDGVTSKEQHPSHTYTQAGRFTVALVVRGPGGTGTKTQSAYITVNESRPTADFLGSPTSGPKPLGVQFSDKSTGVITVRLWDFGDGQTSSSTNPSHTYTEVGSYTVTLIVAGPGGSDTTAKANYITVTQPPAPVADFIGTPTSGMKPLTVQFTDRSTGNITDELWSFGDGQTSTRVFPGPVHTYRDAGTYTVSLTVTGPGGSNTMTRENYITVNTLPVVASAIPDTMLRVGGAAFTRDLNAPLAVFTDPDGDALSYAASSSSPSVAGAVMSGSVLTVSPVAVGSATITMTADDGKGGMASTGFNVQVLPVPPAAPELVSPSNGAMNRPTTLTLSWNPSTGTETCRLQVSTNSAFTTMVFDDSTITAVSQQVGPLANSTAYFWRVKAKNIGGTSAWSPVWSFTTLIQLPSQVSLLAPSEAAVISADSVRFTWRQSRPAVSRYWFELAMDSLLTKPVIDSTLTVADTAKIASKLLNNQTYWWRVRAGNAAGWGPFSAQRKFRIVITGVHAREEIPTEFRLSQNYPNPFWSGATSRFAGNPSTTIEYALPQPSHVELKVYDTLGNEVQTLVNGKQPAGVHRIKFDSQGLPGGVYFYRLRAGERVETRKMVVVK